MALFSRRTNKKMKKRLHLCVVWDYIELKLFEWWEISELYWLETTIHTAKLRLQFIKIRKELINFGVCHHKLARLYSCNVLHHLLTGWRKSKKALYIYYNVHITEIYIQKFESNCPKQLVWRQPTEKNRRITI